MLCETLAGSMIGEKQSITLNVVANRAEVLSDWAVSFGLIVTELVIKALKYAFSTNVSSGHIAATYEVTGEKWVMAIVDNGGGMPVAPDENNGIGHGNC